MRKFEHSGCSPDSFLNPQLAGTSLHSAAAIEIIRHGLIPGGSGVSHSGRRHSYLSPYQIGDTAYKSGVRANQPIEIAFDTKLVLRSGVDLTLTTSDAVTTSQHIPNSCILWVKDTKENTFVHSITDSDKRRIYDQSMYAGKKAKEVFGDAVPANEAQKEEAPAETPGRDSDIAVGTTQIRHIQQLPQQQSNSEKKLHPNPQNTQTQTVPTSLIQGEQSHPGHTLHCQNLRVLLAKTAS